MKQPYVALSHTTSKKLNGYFDLGKELNNHAWMPYMDSLQAEKILAGKPIYTYLLRPSEFKRGFAISFIQKNGQVKHDHFTLIDPKYGIWRNGGHHHVGILAKVIRDMMDCSMEEGQPLA